ncbi:hypothetical protein NUW58_g2994 [Xylaria curta]|uniref:Uncharacterized protein n=1 Tax=Xylaria curta TaxID=42375 RepID=A0ACC1PD06_9PEZI|nr:hypothetical protein NUW58_g2994 [Xylaria curta]
MGVDEGFDMVPRLSRGSEDMREWGRFIDIVRKYYQDDAQVKVYDGYIEFDAGEHPMLPFDGHKFLRFSSKITGRSDKPHHVCDYIKSVRAIARSIFGSRVRPWTEAADQFGFYDWRDVHDSIKSFTNDSTTITVSRFATDGNDGSVADYPLRLLNDQLYEILDIPNKGRGLVARCNIRSGTRILYEKPLLIVRSTSPDLVHRTVASKLMALSKEEQRQFFSMHNNFPGQHAFAGIVKTNALPCGSNAVTAGVYVKIGLINHSCLSNCHNSWNSETQHETIHAIKDILAGEELTIAYDKGIPTAARQGFLRSSFGFDCRCELCTCPLPEQQASDDRRRQIQLLDEQVGDSYTVTTNPTVSLQACHTLLKVLLDEYGTSGMALVARLYYDAFQIAITHGDQARAKVFAERAYKARVACEGEDNPVTKRINGFMKNPASHDSFALGSKMWRSSKTAQPRNLGAEDFEKWLWRRQGSS